ncbi:MAG: hypothetical protein Q3M24_00050 [Candidatus Electrothrix aestuarii]|uniref:Uncharacterized protein n=1 Tax=Candidatus Electrothrix aestuarii TaxID=3062594 RepID=A0AAU8LVB7_9BACT|nr:hypothetical protein [Candidatus Electrothrix aestuarii]
MKKKFDQTRVGNAPASPLRRKTIKTLAYGVGALAGSTVLPDKWVKPVIEGIVLPAHAQTSASLQIVSLNFSVVSGNTGTASVTIQANGSISPAQSGVVLSLSLSGYSGGVTDNATSKDQGFLVAVAEAMVPSAHASEAMCTEVKEVTTGSDGGFTAEFTLSCGPGINNVGLTAQTSGNEAQASGTLQVPTGDVEPEPAPEPEPEPECGATLAVTSGSDSIDFLLDGAPRWSSSITVPSGQAWQIRNNSGSDLTVRSDYQHCDGTTSWDEVFIPASSSVQRNHDIRTGAYSVVVSANLPG